MSGYNYSVLGVQDNDFLLWETPALPMHTAAVVIYRAGPLANSDGGVDFDRIQRAMAAALHRMPRYRQKVHWIQGSDRAVWIDDAHFNLDYHLRHISLPRPGNDAQLKKMASRIMEYPLDRSRPLWETWVVEGLSDGRFALIMKTHHCMVDGASGMDLATILLSRDPDDTEIPDAPRFVPRPAPSDAALRRGQAAARISAPRRFVGRLVDFARETEDLPAELAARARALRSMAQWKLEPCSETPLNGRIGPHRLFDFTEIPLADLKLLRKELDVSINDLVLTIVTGAVREFMTLRSLRPEDLDFRVSTPVNVRTDANRDKIGNNVSSWIVRLPLDEADPLEQVRRIHAATQEAKDTRQAVAIQMVNALHEYIPFDVQGQSAGTQNMIVTNVPGPQFPLYMLGAELLGMYPQAPLIQNLGLVIGVISYNGQLCWGFTGDFDRVPDIGDFRKAIRHAYVRLAEAAGVPIEPLEARAAS